MAGTSAVSDAVFTAVTYFVSIGGGIGVETGAITGDSKVIRGNKSKLQRRNNGNNGKEFLKELLIIKGEVTFL